MRANKRKDMRANKFFPLLAKSGRKARHPSRDAFPLSLFLGLALLLACSSGCAPSSSGGDGKAGEPASSASGDVPELTEEVIRGQINDTRVWEVPEENNAAEPIVWNFDEDEPKEIVVVDKQLEGERATIVLDIKTGSAPGRRNARSLAGQIRTKWELRTGWVLRKWEIVETENISMKYKNYSQAARAKLQSLIIS
jgi:hypothetical protein